MNTSISTRIKTKKHHMHFGEGECFWVYKSFVPCVLHVLTVDDTV